MNITQAIDGYEAHVSVYLAPSSLKSYRSRLRFLRDYFQGRSLESISRRDVDECAVAYRSRRTATTTRLFVVVVKQFFAWCVNEEYLDRSPAVRLRKPAPTRRLPRSLADPTVDDLVSRLSVRRWTTWPDRRNAAMLLIVLNTGLRRAEVAALSWTDVDLAGGFVRVRGKGARERIIPLNKAARQALHTIQRNRQGAVFGHEDGRHLHTNSLDVVLKRWVDRHRLPAVGLHRLRHTFATRLLARGVSLYDIRDLLGHESVRTTEIYLAANPDRLRGAVDLL